MKIFLLLISINSIFGFEPKHKLCLESVDPGPCKNFEPRFYYDIKRRKCTHFMYGGCGGNHNNFKTHYKCIMDCDFEARKYCGGPIKTCDNFVPYKCSKYPFDPNPTTTTRAPITCPPECQNSTQTPGPPRRCPWWCRGPRHTTTLPPIPPIPTQNTLKLQGDNFNMAQKECMPL